MPNRCFSKVIVFSVVIAVILVLASCGNKGAVNAVKAEKTRKSSNKQQIADRIAENRSRTMLQKYDLHPIGKPKITGLLWDISSEEYERGFKLFSESSAKIGLDMSKYKNVEFYTLVFKLEERSQDQRRNALACFKYDSKGIIRGAFLSVPLYTPGVTALNDRFYFMPESLKPEKLVFKNIIRIELFGQFEEESAWQSKADLAGKKDISNFIVLMEKSKPAKGDGYGPIIGDEEYRIVLHYVDGPVVYATLYNHDSQDILELDPFPYWHYKPTIELKTAIKKILSSRGSNLE
jgi:predicted small lipoprotein YifL